MEHNLCSILFRGFAIVDPEDESGCLKPYAHNDHHVFRTPEGKLIAWQDDDECQCGCWDDIEHDTNVCKIYWEVKTII